MILRGLGLVLLVLFIISVVALMGGKIKQQSILGQQSVSISGNTYLRGVPVVNSAECFVDTTQTEVTLPTPIPAEGKIYECPHGDNCQLKVIYPKPAVFSDQNGIFYQVCDLNAKECTKKDLIP